MKRNLWRIYLLVCVLALALTACIGREKAMRQQAMLDEYTTITYYFGEDIIGLEKTVPGKALLQIPDGDYDWQNEAGEPVDLSTYVATEQDASFYISVGVSSLADPAEILYRDGHVRYITAAGNQFLPESKVTRGELAVMLSAVLDTEAMGPLSGDGFTDVPAGTSEAAAVNTLSALGVLSGYADRTFRPDEAVTRAELAAILFRMSGGEHSGGEAFSDLDEDYWAYEYLAWAREAGYMTGYGDGCIYPERDITRAEAVVIINRLRDREPNRAAIDLVCEVLPYVDVTPGHWAFYHIIDASYSNELMAYIIGDAENAEPGFILIDEQLCHVNGETLRLDYYIQGFHTIDGGLYYVPQNGYFIQRFEEGVTELDGDMLYVTADDGPFLTNGDYGYLHFDENGRYTSGSVVVDEHVDRILADILHDDSLTREEKLYKAFLAIRDGGYFYMRRNTGWQRGSTSWALECAEVMYETKTGTCYYWAASFLYLARRLGYQAYPVCGGVGTQNQLHAWVMIEWPDGNEYIFDVELEWAYMTDFYRQGYGYMNMFKQPRSSPNAIYVFPGEDPWYYGVAEENNEDDVFEVPEEWPDAESPDASGETGEGDDPTATIPPGEEDEPMATTPPGNVDDPAATAPPEQPEDSESTTPPEDPEATTAPEAPEIPEATDTPATTEAPVVTDAPVVTVAPVVTAAPVVPDVPVVEEPDTGGELTPVE